MKIWTGPKLFEFTSRQDWIKHASHIWRRHQVNSSNTICLDQLGRICNIGAHFGAAEHDRTYPIEVFLLRPDMPVPATNPAAEQEHPHASN
jgi:hypothetical protein